MNPFLHDTVAQPLTGRPAGSWRFPFNRKSATVIGKQAGAVAMMAGMATSAHAMDVNTATAGELQRLRGVGPRMASFIVQERDRAGHYESLQDLSERVKGLGAKRVQSLEAAGLRVKSGKTMNGGSLSTMPVTRASVRQAQPEIQEVDE